jgi:hypothetical protein
LPPENPVGRFCFGLDPALFGDRLAPADTAPLEQGHERRRTQRRDARIREKRQRDETCASKIAKQKCNLSVALWTRRTTAARPTACFSSSQKRKSRAAERSVGVGQPWDLCDSYNPSQPIRAGGLSAEGLVTSRGRAALRSSCPTLRLCTAGVLDGRDAGRPGCCYRPKGITHRRPMACLLCHRSGHRRRTAAPGVEEQSVAPSSGAFRAAAELAARRGERVVATRWGARRRRERQRDRPGGRRSASARTPRPEP